MTQSLNKLNSLNKDLRIPNLEPDNIKHVMQFYNHNKTKVYSQLHEDFNEFERPDILKLNKKKKEEKPKIVQKEKPLHFPLNVFTDVKIKSKSEYVDWFKDYNFKTRWINDNRVTPALRQNHKNVKDEEKMTFDKCAILKKRLIHLSQLNKGPAGVSQMSQSRGFKTTLTNRVLRDTGNNFRVKSFNRPASTEDQPFKVIQRSNSSTSNKLCDNTANMYRAKKGVDFVISNPYANEPYKLLDDAEYQNQQEPVIGLASKKPEISKLMGFNKMRSSFSKIPFEFDLVHKKYQVYDEPVDGQIIIEPVCVSYKNIIPGSVCKSIIDEPEESSAYLLDEKRGSFSLKKNSLAKFDGITNPLINGMKSKFSNYKKDNEKSTYSTSFTKSSNVRSSSRTPYLQRVDLKEISENEYSSMTTRPNMSLTSRIFYEKIRINPSISQHASSNNHRSFKKNDKKIIITENSHGEKIDKIEASEPIYLSKLREELDKEHSDEFNQEKSLEKKQETKKINKIVDDKVQTKMKAKPISVQNKKLIFTSAEYFKKNYTTIGKQTKARNDRTSDQSLGQNQKMENAQSFLKCAKIVQDKV